MRRIRTLGDLAYRRQQTTVAVERATRGQRQRIIADLTKYGFKDAARFLEVNPSVGGEVEHGD